MAVREAFQWAFMALGVLAVLLACVGVAATPGVAAKIHYTAPASIVAPVALAIAAFLDDGLSLDSLKFAVAAGLLVLTGPVVTHATARAARIRERGRWDLRPAESDPPPPS